MAEWRGQILLDIDLEADNDDEAMEALTDSMEPVLSPRCSIAERRVVLRQFFGHPKAPWQTQTMTQNGSHLIDRAIQVVEAVSDVGSLAPEPDLHIHRSVLEDTIDHALRHVYREGMRTEQRKNKPNIRDAVVEAESPLRIAQLLREYASKYDERGWSDEANLLRDAAAQMDDVPSDLRSQNNE